MDTETDILLREVERSFLGIVMAGTSDIAELADMVQPDEFYYPAHGLIWRAVIATADSGSPIQLGTVGSTLGKIAPDARMDPMLLVDVFTAGPTAGSADWYAQHIVEAAERRHLVRASIMVRQLAESTTLTIDEVRERARVEVDQATSGKSVSELVTIGSVLDSVIEIAEGKGNSTLSTGWDDLDRVVGGFAPGRLVVFGARPGVGKSIAGTNIALYFAKTHGHAVLIASLEMNRQEVVQRMLAADASIDITHLLAGTLTDAEWKSVDERQREIRELPVYVHDNPNMTVTAIRAKAHEVLRERPDLAVIVVDYLQLMDVAGKSSNRVEALGQISRGLKTLASETQTCVIAMAQLNRESLKNNDGKPRMSDLRESGSIEADANVVILLHRPDEMLPDVMAIVDKNRHGPKGTAKLWIQGQYARLIDAEWDPTRGSR